jgi:hypothetical protein
MADLSKVDWPNVLEALDLPTDSSADEIIAALRAVGVLAPENAKPCAEEPARSPGATWTLCRLPQSGEWISGK